MDCLMIDWIVWVVVWLEQDLNGIVWVDWLSKKVPTQPTNRVIHTGDPYRIMYTVVLHRWSTHPLYTTHSHLRNYALTIIKSRNRAWCKLLKVEHSIWNELADCIKMSLLQSSKMVLCQVKRACRQDNTLTSTFYILYFSAI